LLHLDGILRQRASEMNMAPLVVRKTSMLLRKPKGETVLPKRARLGAVPEAEAEKQDKEQDESVARNDHREANRGMASAGHDDAEDNSGDDNDDGDREEDDDDREDDELELATPRTRMNRQLAHLASFDVTGLGSNAVDLRIALHQGIIELLDLLPTPRGELKKQAKLVLLNGVPAGLSTSAGLERERQLRLDKLRGDRSTLGYGSGTITAEVQDHFRELVEQSAALKAKKREHDKLARRKAALEARAKWRELRQVHISSSQTTDEMIITKGIAFDAARLYKDVIQVRGVADMAQDRQDYFSPRSVAQRKNNDDIDS